MPLSPFVEKRRRESCYHPSMALDKPRVYDILVRTGMDEASAHEPADALAERDTDLVTKDDLALHDAQTHNVIHAVAWRALAVLLPFLLVIIGLLIAQLTR